VLLCLLLYNERKDYDDLIGALSRRQKVYLCGENSRAKKHTSCLREKREKRERKEERERRASSSLKKKSAKKKNEKNSLFSAFCFFCLLFESKIIKEKEQVKLFSCSRKSVPSSDVEHFLLSSFFVPTTNTRHRETITREE
jgi:hypothetical protein